MMKRRQNVSEKTNPKAARMNHNAPDHNAAPDNLTPPPAGYADWLVALKARIHTAQQRATLAVNRELVLLYW
ncbi:MAG: hypothetical protein LBO00_05255, partial [Zoogloeaceae bacterium]|nr:hypothetical protein [Zoogloeaceae bacterium]